MPAGIDVFPVSPNLPPWRNLCAEIIDPLRHHRSAAAMLKAAV